MGGGTEETENIEATADAEAPVVQVEEKQTLAREGSQSDLKDKGEHLYACGYSGGAAEKGEKSIVSSKLLSDEAVSICVKVSGLEGLQVDQILGDAVTLDEEEFAELCKVMEDEQADIYKDCYKHFLEYFKRVDEEGKGSLLGDTFKQVLADMEGEYGMSFLTERAMSLIKVAEECAKDSDASKGLQAPLGEGENIFYEDFLRKELKSPRDLKL